MIVIETPRLQLREMTTADRQALCRTLQDSEVMYAYNGPFSDEEVDEWLERQLARYRQYGYGLWAVVLKATGEMIGQCGLTLQQWNGREMLEAGYLFQRSHWHQGYATEAASACMDYAFGTLNSPIVCSIIRDNNLPSQQVALRNGMTRQAGVMVKHYRGAGMPHWLFVRPTGSSSGPGPSAPSATTPPAEKCSSERRATGSASATGLRSCIREGWSSGCVLCLKHNSRTVGR